MNKTERKMTIDEVIKNLHRSENYFNQLLDDDSNDELSELFSLHLESCYEILGKVVGRDKVEERRALISSTTERIIIPEGLCPF